MSLLDPVLGKKRLQRWFERLHTLALKGMNYGRASDYAHNGEAWLVDDLRHRISAPTAVLFDVGANQGTFANTLIKAWRGLNYQLYCFEPSAKTFALLKTHVADLPYVHLVNKGLGEKAEHVELYSDKDGSGLASVYHRDLSHHRISLSIKESIELTTLDKFCTENKIETIDFLKLDVEGHEMAVLKGASRMIGEGRVGFIQFEFGGCNIDSRTYFRDYFNFFKGKYNLFRILSNGLQPLPAYSEKLEVFQSANYLAVKR
jgi:FkbM family methyltransferase